MTEWVYLAGAILIEVASTLSLRAAATGRRRWYATRGPGYVVSFSCSPWPSTRASASGSAYGIWTAVGVALTAVLSKVLFDEPLTRTMVLGIVLIAAGVVLLEPVAAGYPSLLIGSNDGSDWRWCRPVVTDRQ